MRTFQKLSELADLVGQEVAVSDWIVVTQQQVNLFAEATGDHQWIHIDVERAQQGPFGAPIAHGFLTLSLLPKFFESALEVRETRMGVNYGLNRVRFTAPVPVGSRVRLRQSVLACLRVESGTRLTFESTMEIEGQDRPALVAETLLQILDR